MSTLVLTVCALFAIALVKFLKLYSARQSALKKIENIPGPPALPILGNGLEFKEGTSVVLPKLMRFTIQYGLTFKCILGTEIHIFTSDPKFIEFVCTSKTQITKSYSYRFLHNWLGTGLLTATNPKWKTHRKILTPTFHNKILESCLPIFQTNNQNLIQHLNKSIGKDINIRDDIVYCSLDIICEAAMGFCRNALKDKNSSDYAKSVKYMGKMVVARTFSVWRQIDLIYKCSSDCKQEVKCVEYLHNLTDKVIKTKREELLGKKKTELDDIQSEHNSVKSNSKMTFLDLLLRCSTEEGGFLNDDDIRQELDTFMFAGHDTVSSALSFTLYALSKNRDVQDKVYDEICKVMSTDESFTMEKLNELKYLEMVIKEVMRLYPPVPMIGRELTDDITFDGQLYPKGLTVTILSYVMHRLPEFYDDPEKFNPERFNYENSSKRCSFTYIPFSAGPRNCIGQKFAMLEMKSIVSALLRQFRIESSDVPLNLAAETVLTSVNGVYIRLEVR